MAPEMISGQKCQEDSIDFFALGVILFLMRAGYPPFNFAKKDDKYYKLFYVGRINLFWQKIEYE